MCKTCERELSHDGQKKQCKHCGDWHPEDMFDPAKWRCRDPSELWCVNCKELYGSAEASAGLSYPNTNSNQSQSGIMPAGRAVRLVDVNLACDKEKISGCAPVASSICPKKCISLTECGRRRTRRSANATRARKQPAPPKSKHTSARHARKTFRRLASLLTCGAK